MKKQSSSIKMTHLFEPFYTSKEVGKGTGLGLSLIYSIVQNHNGWIDVSSEIDKGTTFRIYLPIHQQEDETTEGLPAIAGPAIRHILLVEDDPVVRKLAGEILKNMGYRVSCAESIQAAEELFARKGEGFDLLFSDILLPDGNGIELAESLRTKRSGLSILLFSGGTDEQINMELIKQKGFAFMNKPFSLNAMLDALRLAVIDP